MNPIQADTALLPSGNSVPLESVLRTEELNRRPSRPPDYESENRALASLMEEMANAPKSILQRLVETALVLCRAHSAGISILDVEAGRTVFKWHATAGQMSGFLGNAMPRDASPCGTVLDQNRALLMSYPQRHYPFPPELASLIGEVLLIPFRVRGETVGTVWVVAHDESRQFDREDERLMSSLARFAATAYQVLSAEERLGAMNADLTRRVAEVQDSRRAALNLMEDAVGAHRLLEAVNVKLRAEAEERQRAEEALRASEERFRALADNMSQFAWMADAKGWIFWYNQRWYDYTGTTLEEMQGWGWKKVHHPDHVERVVQRIQHSWDTGEVWEDLFPLRGKDGEYRWFLSRAIPIRDAEGRVLRWFGTNTDVTEQRAAQEALREADRKKDEFLATLAHELRNPLAPIRNSLHILRLAASEGGAAARVHEMMERQVNHMVRLVDDLMEVSRITRGKIELRREQVELAAVVRSAVETSKPLIEAARHQLAISLPAEPLMLEADPVRLAQVVSNLLNNAAKYTEEEGQIWLTAQREGANAVVSVRDSGVGIPAEMLPKVFDLFTQVDHTHNRAQGGLGIGLTLVRSLVEMHGGSVEARSDGFGRGSEFVVRLPLAAEQPGAREGGRRDAQSAAVAPRRILVVDDNRDAADSLSMLLKYLGADVFTVHDGPTALAALGSYQPSVMLLDIGMPGMDGYEVARRVRRQPEGRDVTLIALSGWGQEEDRRRSKEAGIDHHLVKPVDLGALQALLASLPPRHLRPVGAK